MLLHWNLAKTFFADKIKISIYHKDKISIFLIENSTIVISFIINSYYFDKILLWKRNSFTENSKFNWIRISTLDSVLENQNIYTHSIILHTYAWIWAKTVSYSDEDDDDRHHCSILRNGRCIKKRIRLESKCWIRHYTI